MVLLLRASRLLSDDLGKCRKAVEELLGSKLLYISLYSKLDRLSTVQLGNRIHRLCNELPVPLSLSLLHDRNTEWMSPLAAKVHSFVSALS